MSLKSDHYREGGFVEEVFIEGFYCISYTQSLLLHGKGKGLVPFYLHYSCDSRLHILIEVCTLRGPWFLSFLCCLLSNQL